ncbi:hypothetical protein O9993_16645 [Vibrio lentus]|nr:hypothetical protein [Vibrio lentus]
MDVSTSACGNIGFPIFSCILGYSWNIGMALASIPATGFVIDIARNRRSIVPPANLYLDISTCL